MRVDTDFVIGILHILFFHISRSHVSCLPGRNVKSLNQGKWLFSVTLIPMFNLLQYRNAIYFHLPWARQRYTWPFPS